MSSGLLTPFPLNLGIIWWTFVQYELVEYRRLADLRDAEHDGRPPVGDWPSLDLMDFLTGLLAGLSVVAWQLFQLL